MLTYRKYISCIVYLYIYRKIQVSFLGFLYESSNFPGHRYARMLPGKEYQNLSHTEPKPNIVTKITYLNEPPPPCYLKKYGGIFPSLIFADFAK